MGFYNGWVKMLIAILLWNMVVVSVIVFYETPDLPQGISGVIVAIVLIIIDANDGKHRR